MLTIRKNQEIIAIVYNNTDKKAQIFSACKNMGAEDIKHLLEDLTKRND